MIVYLNGEFVPAESASVSVFDRGFLYGDGLFETLRIHKGTPFLWSAHSVRLRRGAAALRIPLFDSSQTHGQTGSPENPDSRQTLISDDSLLAAIRELLRRNGLADAIVRIHVSRGQGIRGYSIRNAITPTIVITAHPAPELANSPPASISLHTSKHRLLCGDPLGQFKTTCKLTHILARTEAEDAGADDALLLDSAGHVAETSSANLFWLQGDRVHTPDLRTGCLAGVARGFVIEHLRHQGLPVVECLDSPEVLHRASGIFVTFSTRGIVEVSQLDRLPLPSHPRVAELHAIWQAAIIAGS